MRVAGLRRQRTLGVIERRAMIAEPMLAELREREVDTRGVDAIEPEGLAKMRSRLLERAVFAPLARNREQLFLDPYEPRLAETTFVDPPNRMEEIEVRRKRRTRDPMEHEPRREQRPVEALSVIGDEERRTLDPLGEDPQH